MIAHYVRRMLGRLGRAGRTGDDGKRLSRPPRAGRKDEGGSSTELGDRFGAAGVSLDVAAQRALLDELREEPYQALFRALRADPLINGGFDRAGSPRPDAVRNPYLPTPDAELYAAMLVRFRPELVIEVGSGFSTAIARLAIDRAGVPCTLRVIDPEPRIRVEELADEVEPIPVERSSLARIGIPERSLLFIDSSHTLRSGGDLPLLYCRILPSLPANVLVHVHDIFLPYDYPAVYVRRGYTEQYLLHALLAHSHRFRVLFATHLMAREHAGPMRSVLGPSVCEGPFRGASLWLASEDLPDTQAVESSYSA